MFMTSFFHSGGQFLPPLSPPQPDGRGAAAPLPPPPLLAPLAEALLCLATFGIFMVKILHAQKVGPFTLHLGAAAPTPDPPCQYTYDMLFRPVARSEFGGVLFLRKWTFSRAFWRKVDFFVCFFFLKWTFLHAIGEKVDHFACIYWWKWTFLRVFWGKVD